MDQQASSTPQAGVLQSWAIVVAGGSGRRYGGLKQFELHAGRRLIDWSIDAASARCDGVVAVVPGDFDGQLAADVVVAGGDTRSASVRRGLAAIPDNVDVVVVHDAARPGASASLFAAVIQAVREGVDAAIPGLPIADTLKRIGPPGSDGAPRVLETVDRDEIVAVQTPQAFRAAALRAAHDDGGDATDDAGLIEAGGGAVVIVPGEPAALKVTTPADMVLLASLAGLGRAAPPSVEEASGAQA